MAAFPVRNDGKTLVQSISAIQPFPNIPPPQAQARQQLQPAL
jgi:hypothetical protein